MKKIRMPLLFVVALLMMAASAPPLPTLPQRGKSMQDFVPQGWHVLSVTEGDIDKDIDADTVLTLASDQENALKPGDKVQYPRLLVFLLKDKKGYTLAASSATAILCKTCGGTSEDPFRQPTVENGDVVIRHEITGKKGVATTHRFRYQDGSWYLVGKKSDMAAGPGSTSVEMDMVMGKKVKQTTGSTGKKISDYVNFQPKPLSKVTSFDIGQEWWDVNNWGSGS